MGTPRLKAGFRAAAIIRRAQLAGHFAALVKRGDEDAGALLLQLEVAVSRRLHDRQRIHVRPQPDRPLPRQPANWTALSALAA